MNYLLKKNHIEIKSRDRKQIREGVSFSQNNIDSDVVKKFTDLDEAKKELSKLKTRITELSGPTEIYYLIEEYYIEEDTENGDIVEFSKIQIEVIEKPSYNTLGSYDNFKDAEDALNEYDGFGEVYLSF